MSDKKDETTSSLDEIVEGLVAGDADEPESLELDTDNVREAEIVFDDDEAKAVEKESFLDEELDPSSEVKGLARTDPLAQYLREVQRYPLLTKEEEYELAVKYRETGDKQAAERLVTSNLRFVVKVAAEYAKYGSKLIDVVQEGNVGLMHAVREFNPYKNVRLITYAVWWIRGYIKEYLMRQTSLVRIGSNSKQKKLFHQIRKEERALELQGKEPDVKQLAQRLDVTEKEIVRMQQRIRHGDLSLDQNVDSESRTQWLDMQFDEDEELQDEKLARQELLNMILDKLIDLKKSLNEKELYILKHRILEEEPKTLQEIGDHFSISRERARQLEARILKRVKEQLLEEMPKPLL